jgi:hypothetical protein
MSYLGLFLLLVLSKDVGGSPDGGLPLWVPQMRPAATVEGSYGLRLWGKGYFYEDSKFEARVAPDGTVSFKDKRGRADFIPFSWASKTRQQRQQPLPERSAKDPTTARRAPWLPPPEQTRGPTRKVDPNELCPPGSSCWTPLPATGSAIGVSGSFDLTDEIMRTLGQDPYARDKARFLSATFEFRIKLAIEARKQQMKEALDFFPQHLEALWADTRYSPRERRRILYELWVEMAATPEGERAAKMIDLFIRRQLPCGAADGYTRTELDAFRTSHPDRPFAPVEACSNPR